MGAEHSLCSRIDDFSYDPVAESPAAYVRVVRANLLTNMVATKDVVDTSEMTLDQLRAYYEEGGANRLKSMNADQQQDLFKQFVVSFASFLSPLKVEFSSVGPIKQAAAGVHAQGQPVPVKEADSRPPQPLHQAEELQTKIIGPQLQQSQQLQHPQQKPQRQQRRGHFCDDQTSGRRRQRK